MLRVMIAAASLLVGSCSKGCILGGPCPGGGIFGGSSGSSGPSGPSGPSVGQANLTWHGVIGATGVQGTFVLTSTGTGNERPLTGSVKFGAATTPLTGTWNLPFNRSSLCRVTANGGAYVLTTDPFRYGCGSHIHGTYTGAGGGSFNAEAAAVAAEITHYCGSYTETVGGAATGYWSFNVVTDGLYGIAATSSAPLRMLSGFYFKDDVVTYGLVTGGRASIIISEYNLAGSAIRFVGAAAGAVSATAAAGTFSDSAGTSGTWSASNAACP